MLVTSRGSALTCMGQHADRSGEVQVSGIHRANARQESAQPGNDIGAPNELVPGQTHLAKRRFLVPDAANCGALVKEQTDAGEA